MKKMLRRVTRLGIAVLVVVLLQSTICGPHHAHAAARGRHGHVRRPLPRHYGSVHKRPHHHGYSKTVTTPRGGEATVRRTPRGTAARGETAGGYEYAGARSRYTGRSRSVVKSPDGNVRVRSRGPVVRTLPAGYRKVYVYGRPYYRYGYRYYWPYYYGGTVYYREVDPPEGAVVDEVPEEAETETIEGEEYHVADGVYYQAKDGKYAVVPAPTEPWAILERMHAFVHAHDALRIDTREERAEPQPDGSLKTVKRLRWFAVRRPDRLRAAGREGDAVRSFYYNGSSVTLYDVENKMYATVPLSGPNPDMLDSIRDEYGVTVPLADLLRPDALEKLQPLVNESTYNGREEVEGRLCDAVTLQSEDAVCRVWIQADRKAPLLRKVEITYVAHPGAPKYAATIVNWVKPPKKLSDEFFTFTPPKDAVKIEMLPLLEDDEVGDAAVKEE
jgi:hypothetical protein